ncbi:calmodulin-binding transcription activator 1-like [Ctenocephalides felis]|uniref:calmodulin-binding transcription activator 1-like n=1 Tax=Ctenocephalides felis TaxID=7515 RepID=UPI000E6E4C9D|nr:calmodulin-binding transcription activator 1-like [Ctenocephalides felis]
MLLYSRKKVRYRRDGYCWKKRKDGKTTREDHMKLKVQGTECIYGCYVHSAILPTFHRRCYWLLQNPDIVLVHYLNVPYPDDNKMAVIAPSIALWGDRKEWTKEELVCQLKPMFFSEDDPDINNDLEISVKLYYTAHTVETIVGQLMERQRLARQAALVRQLECGCPDSTCADGKSCSHPTVPGSGTTNRRTLATGGQSGSQTNAVDQSKSHGSSAASGSRTNNVSASDNNNQVSSTTGTMLLNTNNHQQRVYASKHLNHNFHHHAIREARLVTTQHAGHQGGAVHTGAAPPLVLSLSQIHGTGGLIILNNHHHQANTTAATLQQHHIQQHHHQQTAANQQQITNQQTNHAFLNIRKGVATIVPKVEAMETCSRPEDANANQQQHTRFVNTGNKNEQKNNQQHQQQFCVTDVNGFFDETLDLSHEDIQRTLSANMPRCPSDSDVVNVTNTAPSNDIEDTPEINPMDFIENCDVMVSPGDTADDDVFVNLDAFDMLGDFPDLEVLDATNEISVDKRSPPAIDFREGSASITDYSPEWAYPEGGVKVLVTGPWHSTSSPYTVLFDSFPVPTTLVQSGVLRCYCPGESASRNLSSDEAGCKINQENSNQEAGCSSASNSNVVGEPDVRVLTLAEQIIAAMPERIKNEIEDMHLGSPCGGISPSDSLGDVFMEPLLESQSDHSEFNFEHSDHNYRYYDAGTPCSSLSPASSSCLQSPASFTLDSPSPPPTTQDHCDFLHAGPFESDFNKLTLSDREQRELYEAAKTIQQAYRIYKGRQKLEEQDKERAAAILIQNYYRRYKQYAYFKQMTQAALVIQNGFRSYCEYKRFKKNQQAASCIQNYYRSYRDQGRTQSSGTTRETTPSGTGLKRTYSQRRQHQAARKIQQFMRQSKNILQKERAEREKQSAQPDYQAALQRSPPRVDTFQPTTDPNRSCPNDATEVDTTIPENILIRRNSFRN